MRKLILYAALSLDGKIAKPDGSVDWLHELPNPGKVDHGYNNFYASIGATVMGNTTYRQILSFDVPFPYQGKSNYVITRDTALQKDQYVQYVSEDPVAFVKQLKKEKGKDIWLVGGGEVATLFLRHQLIDEMQLFIMPVILGAGIALFGEGLPQTWLHQERIESFSTGAVGLTYTFKND